MKGRAARLPVVLQPNSDPMGFHGYLNGIVMASRAHEMPENEESKGRQIRYFKYIKFYRMQNGNIYLRQCLLFMQSINCTPASLKKVKGKELTLLTRLCIDRFERSSEVTLHKG